MTPSANSSAGLLESSYFFNNTNATNNNNNNNNVNTVGKMRPSPLSSDKVSVMLPSIETGKAARSDLLRRRPMSPLSPPISPDDPDAVVRSPVLSNTRSPSPFSYSDHFLNTPTSSASPITSPDEPNLSGFTPIIKEEEPSPPAAPPKQQRRRTICGGDAQKLNGKRSASKKIEKVATAPRHKSLSKPSGNTNAGEEETKQPKGRSRSRSTSQAVVSEVRQPAKAGNRAASKQASPEAPQVSNNAPIAGRKRKASTVEPKMEDEEDDGEDDDEQEGNGSTNKRARFLERNRIAASKCRKKKKVMNQRLEEKSRLLHQHNRYLNQLVSSLKSDVLRLKQCLLVHHSCEDEPIKRYLQYEAGKVFNTAAPLI